MEAMCDVFTAFLLKRAEAGISLREIKVLGGYISNQTAEDLSRLGNLRVSMPSVQSLWITRPYGNDEHLV